jgi:hypothetical protein
MSAEAPSPCYIDALSNELLDDIFMFIPMLYRVPSYMDPDPPSIPQALALMHVARRFRQAMLHTRHWLTWEWTFFIHLNGTRPGEVGMDRYSRQKNLFATLLMDPAVVQCLSRKTDWVFPSHPPILELIAESVPSFFHTARRLAFSYPPREFMLGRIWHHVVELKIRMPGLDLTSLALAFPNVQYLHLQLYRDGVGYIHSFQHLVHLELMKTELDFPRRVEAPFGLSIFPLGSAQSLTYLEFDGPNFSLFDINEFDLDALTNLQHLTIYDPSLPNFLLPRVSSKLVSLVVAIVDGQEFSFTRPCLSSLQALTITIIPAHSGLNPTDFEKRNDRNMALLESLSCLVTMRDLVLLRCGFVPNRVGCLAQLRQLESLFYELEEDPDASVSDENPKLVLSRVFEHEPKPKITLIKGHPYRMIEYRPNTTRFPAVL